MGVSKKIKITAIFTAAALFVLSPFIGLFYVWENQAESLYKDFGSKNITNHPRERDAFLHAYLAARFAQFTNAYFSNGLGWFREMHHDLTRVDNYGGPQDYYNNWHAAFLYANRKDVKPFTKDIDLAKDILKRIDRGEFVLNLHDQRTLKIKTLFNGPKSFKVRPL